MVGCPWMTRSRAKARARAQGSPATVIQEKEYVFVIGQVSEDFETGDFSQHPWGHGGDANWTITGTAPFEGDYSAHSGDITDNESSDLFVDYCRQHPVLLQGFVRIRL